MLLSYNGKRPTIGHNVYIAPTAVIVGDVEIHDNASVWFNCVVRGDEERIVIGAGTNIQDNSTLHADPGMPLIIGAMVTVGHNAVVHSCTVEDNVLIGMNATLLNQARIKSGSIIAAGALIKEGQQIGPYQLAAGMPAQIKRQLGDDVLPDIKTFAESYLALSRHYLENNEEQ